MTDNQSFRKVLRRSIRGSIVTIGTCIISRPFEGFVGLAAFCFMKENNDIFDLVIMIRQIAQAAAGDNYYGGVFNSFRTIYREEGLQGLFSYE